MAHSPRRNPRLKEQDRDYEILEHLRRYRLTTPEVLHRLFFDDSDRNAVTKVTSRLCLHDFLQRHPLYAGYSYFTLGRRGTKVAGLSPSKVGPLGPQALYREYGTLAYCCLQSPLRERLTVSEIQKKHPEFLQGKLDATHYYLDRHEQQTRLGYIWVEGAGDVRHIVDKVEREIIADRRVIPALRQFIDAGQFLVAVVTLNEDKKVEISRALNTIRTPVFFRVAVVPELRQLLPGAWQ